MIFELHRLSCPCSCATDPLTLTKHCVGARILSFELSRGEAKTSKNRSAGAFDSVLRTEHAQPRLRDRPQASRESPGHAFGRLPAVCGSPGASQDWPWSVIWASTNRPERIWTRPRHGRGCPGWSKIDFSSIFGRAGVDFHRFRSIFRRFSLELPATKPESEAQKRIVRSMLPDLVLALCICCVLFVHFWECHLNITCLAFFRHQTTTVIFNISLLFRADIS